MVDFKEFDLGEHRYQIATMDGMAGTDVLFLLSPIAVPIAAIYMASLEDGGKDKGRVFLENLEPLTKFLSTMPRDDRHFIFATCLRVVSRSAGGGKGWQPIWNVQAGGPQFADLRPMDLCKILWEVLTNQVVPLSLESLLQ